MRSELRAVAGRTFDLVVVGGGIHGVAVAREAALRGASVAVVEQEDFGALTSSASSRLVHGGVRYLAQGRIGLVREALHERERLLRLAPHLVRPLPMLMPFFADGPGRRWLVRLGLEAYWWLAGRSTLPPARSLGPDDCRRAFPSLRTRGLRGGILFFDGVTEDQRLVLAVALAAAAAGAVLVNHAELVGIRGTQLVVRDRLRDEEQPLAARQIVNAAGPALDHVRRRLGIDAPDLVRTTRGSHLVLDPLDQETALAAFLPDRRIQFVVPHRDGTICGTTDVDDDYDAAGPRVPPADRSYLLAALTWLLEQPVAPERVRFAYSGWRALPNRQGVPGAIGRESVLVSERCAAGPVHSIVGGKLTTHRALAERAVARWLGLAGASPTRTLPLPGGSGPALVDDPLWWRHGSRCHAIRALARDAEDLQPLWPDRDFLGVEVRAAVELEGAATFTDLVLRRLFHSQGPPLDAAQLRPVHERFLREQPAGARSFAEDFAALQAVVHRLQGTEVPVART